LIHSIFFYTIIHCTVVVVSCNVAAVTDGAVVEVGVPVDDNGNVVDGTAVVRREVVPIVIAVVVTSMHAIIPTVT
jgi:hypothetical protein